MTFPALLEDTLPVARTHAEMLCAVTGHRVAATDGVLKDLRLSDYPSTTPQLLCEILMKMTSRVFDQLRQVEAEVETASENNLKLLTTQIHLLNDILNRIGKTAETVMRARTELNVTSLVRSLETIVEQISRESVLIVHPQWGTNYTYRELVGPLREVTEALASEAERVIFRGYPQRFVVLTFPLVDKDLILHNAVLAHELGHFVDEVHAITEYVTKQAILDQELVEAIYSSELIERRGEEPRKVHSEVLVKALQLVNRWIQELVADVVGVCLLGPAMILAFEPIVLALQSLDREHGAYPPPRVRLSIMLKQLETIASVNDWGRTSATVNGNAYVVESVKEHFAHLQALASLPVGEAKNPYVRLGLRAVERSWPHIQQKVGELSGNNWYWQPEYIRDAFRLTELLTYDLPPSEFPEGGTRLTLPSMQAILNAGWFYFLSYRADNQYFRNHLRGDVYDQFLRINRLVAKAIEVVQVSREYRQRKGNRDD